MVRAGRLPGDLSWFLVGPCIVARTGCDDGLSNLAVGLGSALGFGTACRTGLDWGAYRSGASATALLGTARAALLRKAGEAGTTFGTERCVQPGRSI